MKALANRVDPFEVAVYKRLIDDDDWRRRRGLVVAASEQSAGK